MCPAVDRSICRPPAYRLYGGADRWRRRRSLDVSPGTCCERCARSECRRTNTGHGTGVVMSANLRGESQQPDAGDGMPCSACGKPIESCDELWTVVVRGLVHGFHRDCYAAWLDGGRYRRRPLAV